MRTYPTPVFLVLLGLPLHSLHRECSDVAEGLKGERKLNFQTKKEKNHSRVVSYHISEAVVAPESSIISGATIKIAHEK